MHLGFIGLGHLGHAVAHRLLDVGHTVCAWNRSKAKAKGLNVDLAASPTEVAEKTEVIFLCLFDSAAVQSVIFQDKGLLSGNVNGKYIIDLTTNHYRDVVKFHELCESAGATYLESPVLGSVIPALRGALTVLTSGPQEAYLVVRPILESIGQNLYYFEEPTTATRMKLINNLVLGSFMATLAEAIAFGEEINLNKADIIEILSVGAGNSKVLDAKKAKLISEDFSPHFSSSLICKDLHCLQDLAYELKKPLFTGAVIKELYARCFEEGIGDLDFSAIYKTFKKD